MSSVLSVAPAQCQNADVPQRSMNTTSSGCAFLLCPPALCLGTLDETQRNIIHQHQVEGKSFHEIGTTMSRPEHWVRRQFHASLRQLKAMLTEPS